MTKHFFSGVYACVNGADALTNFTETSFGCLLSLLVHRHKICWRIGTVYTYTNKPYWHAKSRRVINGSKTNS